MIEIRSVKMMDNKVGSNLLSEFKNGENVLAKYKFVPKTKIDIFNHHEVTLKYAYRYLSKKLKDYVAIVLSGDTNAIYEHLQNWEVADDINVAIRLSTMMTTLHYACNSNWEDIAKLLVEKGAKINVPDTHKTPPLSFACEKGYMNMIDFMLEKGANVTQKNVCFFKILHLSKFLNFCDEK